MMSSVTTRIGVMGHNLRNKLMAMVERKATYRSVENTLNYPAITPRELALFGELYFYDVIQYIRDSSSDPDRKMVTFADVLKQFEDKITDADLTNLIARLLSIGVIEYKLVSGIQYLVKTPVDRIEIVILL